jgi:Ser/Thr protein kinase RdoA (MazF antagonist)
MADSREQFLGWARSALAQYPLQVAEVKFLGHSDNLTFRVTDAGGALYLLRLHSPVSSFYQGMRQLPAAISAELTWMEALYLEGGVTVQQPVHSIAGTPLVLVDVSPGKNLPCTLLTWLEGEHFSPAAPESQLLVERLGELVARMHNFSSGWSTPLGLARPRYDGDHFRRIFARLLHGVDLGIFTEAVYWTLRSTVREITDETSQLSFDPDQWGMIHADLHVGNFLVNGQEIIPIDFSFCGLGHYLFDLSVCLGGGLKKDLRQSFLRGYRSQRPLEESAFHAVEAYALAGRMSYYAYLIDHPGERKWLQTHIPLLAENECSRFLKGESILEIL